MKHLTQLFLPASTTGMASLNVAAGATVTSPNSGDIWNEAGVLMFRAPAATKTIATVDQLGGASAPGDIDGGTPDSVYTASQIVDGGSP